MLLIPVTFHTARPHTEQDKEIYRIAVERWNNDKKRLNYNDLPEILKTHNNRDSFTDRFKVVADTLAASHTVVAHIAKDGHYYIHPDVEQNRSLTPREVARLQTFPDNYFFESVSEIPGRTAAFKQIGNAVPILLGQKIAEKLKEQW
ncbi:MAG: DNA cytosine methyltransferase [Nitrospinae bacterium]|nr:DNA cytosine methyltransferase [Nitrospinota bacterium]